MSSSQAPSGQAPSGSAPATPAPDAGVGRVAVGDIELAYETFGDPSDPPLLLVMGLGTQMLGWPDQLCRDLAAAGHHVVRFDNRDAGLSTHLDDVDPPRLWDLLFRRGEAPYGIDEMADDALGLIDVLGLGSAHVVGASMGGFIVQCMALRQPAKVRSLTLMMTSTGSRRVGWARPRILAHMLHRRVAANREEAVEMRVESDRLISSPGYPFDEATTRDVAGRAYDRAYDPEGALRQVWAIAGQRNRTRSLARITSPTLVVHGLEDPLVHVSGGLAAARAIPSSTFVGFPGMAHDLPRTLWSDLVREISAMTEEVETGTRARRLGAATVISSTTPSRWRRGRRRAS